MTPRPILFRPGQRRPHPWLPVAFGAAYIAFAVFGFALTTDTGGLAVLWVSNGILATALLLLPRRSSIVLAAVCTFADFAAASIFGNPPGQALVIASCDLFEVILAAALLRRVGGAALDPTVVKRFGAMVAFAILPATVAAGTLGAALLALMFGLEFGDAWKAWVLGDFLGMLIGAPGALLLARFGRFNVGASARPMERVALIGLLALTGAFVFLKAPSSLLYGVFPIGLLAIIRLSPPFSLLGIQSFAFIAAAATATGHGPFAASADTMADRILMLQLYLATVQGTALVMTSVLTQKTRAQNGLKRALSSSRGARREAETAAGARGRFLAVMSHEMRTPLNGIAGYAQILDAQHDLTPLAREHVRTIRSSSEVLLSLINDVLDFSRTETHVLQLALAPTRLAPLVDRIVEIVRPMIGEKPVELVVDRRALDGLTHLADERRITQILLNLLSNAAKFTEAGSISVITEVQPGDGDNTDVVTFRVRDTGIGIPPDSLSLLFQPFSQVDATSTRNFHGAGLGLAISRSLVELMGGQITVTSEVGVGSEFRVSAPLRRAAPDVAEPTVSPPAPARNIRRKPRPDRGDATPPHRILVVDDHPVNRQVASLMLEAAGFAVTTAENGRKAVAALREHAFVLVFMDIHMPVMDGLTACRQIRALDGPAARTPMVAMTAAAMADDIEECRAAGMDGHIAKPIRQEEMLAAAARAAGGWNGPSAA